MVEAEWDESQQDSTQEQSKIKIALKNKSSEDEKGVFSPKWDLLVKNNVDGGSSKRISQSDEGDVGSTR